MNDKVNHTNEAQGANGYVQQARWVNGHHMAKGPCTISQLSCEGMGPCEARAKKVMPCLCNEWGARVHTWLVNTKRARAKHTTKAVRTADECGTPVLLSRL